jgi:hypothetical protein
MAAPPRLVDASVTPVRQTIETARLSANRMLAPVWLSTALLLAGGQGVSLVMADESPLAEHLRDIALERYAGFYEGPNALVVVTRNGDQLFVQWSGEIKMSRLLMQLPGQVKMPMSPTGASEHGLPREGPKVAFTTDEKGQTSELVLRPKAGEDIHAKRTADLPSAEPIRASLDKDIFDGFRCWFQLIPINSGPIPLLATRDQDHLLVEETC